MSQRSALTLKEAKEQIENLTPEQVKEELNCPAMLLL